MLGSALRTIVAFLSILAATVGFLCIYIFVFYSSSPTNTVVNAQMQNIKPTQPLSRWILMEGIVNDALKGTTGEYSVVIKNLNTNETYMLNENQTYKTASLYKLWVMAATYKQIDDGVLMKNTLLADNIEDLNSRFNIATDSAERSEGTVSMTIEEALVRMITYSDNYSALLLSSKVRLKNVSDFLKDKGLTQSQVGTTLPTTTALDMALFYEKLYKNELASTQSTEEMLSLLKRQQIKRKLPMHLPIDVIIAHKTGELDQYTHDAGIVYTALGNYIIVVLSESANPKGAEERIADISKGVYSYFLNNSVN